ncbi:MAG: LPXTG cell wall anchor domain-containing protein [Oscillospiraceae bacterium]|nr:LPXTG cell wall anchor domain-containing protein [Oscillospiraceae bacterium]
MKKVISIVLVVILALALSSVAMADYSYSAETGKITGSYAGNGGWIETYVNGSAAAGDTLSISATAGETYEITVYEDGVLVYTETVTAEAAEEPQETEEPAETETPAETEEPAETETSAETEEPAETETPVDGGTSDTGNTSGEKDSVPKTGEADYMAVLVAVIMLSAVVAIVAKKRNAVKK